MPLILRVLCCAFVTLFFSVAANAEKDDYSIHYYAQLEPQTGLALVRISLEGNHLPSTLTLHLDPTRHQSLTADGTITFDGDKAQWQPSANTATLAYEFVIDKKKSSGRFDSLITDDWTIFRTDKLIPPISARAPRSLQSHATLEIKAPEGWNALAPYAKDGDGIFQLKDPGRRFIRPKGWMIAGKIGSRQDIIAGTDTVIAAPLGGNVRRQDTLAFLSWTLPELKKVFPQFPRKLLIVMAGDPMWRGGLSGTRSLFMHTDRPLISGNRTSTMLHELIHVATGIRGDKESDWIVEGIAEYYSLEILRRTGGISERRFNQALEELAEWGQESPDLLVRRSAGPVTARAAVILHTVDKEIQASCEGNASLDDVVKALAAERGEISLEKFRTLAEKVAGKPLPQLERTFLSGKKKP
ncbi:hypothetical protein PVT68_02430 [Microbulbifer bruguierae]|uniref:Peptidase M61 catalytic domain-containing protein n=1 Tax=Microbulbifer bruguierae TaxID=3029061 RepID=A0ABY8NFM5_9GAMM|nr:hypothetical protein [Microbulbifer bruguierae]WGL17169.1 hypothetical protein PVT68_02430 [Microbulbifer bruguierae]